MKYLKRQTNKYAIWPNRLLYLIVFTSLCFGFLSCGVSNTDQHQTKKIKKEPLNRIVRYSPFVGSNNNFLVVDPNRLSKAKTYELEIKKRASDSTKSLMANDGQVIWSGKFTAEQPYIKIPEKFHPAERGIYTYFLIGYSGSGNKVAEGPITGFNPPELAWPPPRPIWTECSLTCNGRSYAYQIDVIVGGAVEDGYSNSPEGIDFMLSLHPTDQVFYQYMGDIEYQQWAQTHNTHRVIRNPQGLAPGVYTDAQGNPVAKVNQQGDYVGEYHYPLWAIPKGLGPWGGYPLYLEAPANPDGGYVTEPESNWLIWDPNSGRYCFNGNSQGLIAAIATLNQFADFHNWDNTMKEKPLKCNGIPYVGSGNGGGGPGTFTGDQQGFMECYFDNVVKSGGANPMAGLEACKLKVGGDSGGDGGPNKGDWNITMPYSVVFEPISGGNGNNGEKSNTIFPRRFAKEGKGFVLDKGLYNVKFIFKDRRITRILGYAPSRIDFTKGKS